MKTDCQDVAHRVLQTSETGDRSPAPRHEDCPTCFPELHPVTNPRDETPSAWEQMVAAEESRWEGERYAPETEPVTPANDEADFGRNEIKDCLKALEGAIEKLEEEHVTVWGYARRALGKALALPPRGLGVGLAFVSLALQRAAGPLLRLAARLDPRPPAPRDNKPQWVRDLPLEPVPEDRLEKTHRSGTWVRPGQGTYHLQAGQVPSVHPDVSTSSDYSFLLSLTPGERASHDRMTPDQRVAFRGLARSARAGWIRANVKAYLPKKAAPKKRRR